jgi:hypothetical protein
MPNLRLGLEQDVPLAVLSLTVGGTGGTAGSLPKWPV